MKLYIAPGACSLADHIALNEAGIPFEIVKVDLKAKRTETGEDYSRINPKGYVPALQFDDGDVLTENVAILTWISERSRALTGDEPLPDKVMRFRQLEMLAFISTEIHKNFKPFFSGGDDAAKRAAADALGKRLDLVAANLKGDYLFGATFTVADAYLFVMLTWAKKNALPLPPALTAFFQRMAQRPAVQKTLAAEGLAIDKAA